MSTNYHYGNPSTRFSVEPKFDEIVAKTGDQIGAPFCADCAQRIGAYELYQQTNQSVEALMTVLDLPWEGNALDFIGEEVTLP
ncbi:MAG: hypothetical protein JTJ13_01015 [Limosilactobacillus fermentum]|nr:hypothetical protein [Limosilactobacillus fermentum]